MNIAKDLKEFKQYSLENIFSNRIKKFQQLMKFKIREILLVSSIYDNYLFEEDGRLYEMIRREYQNLNLSQAPEIIHVTTGMEALDLLGNENEFDLIIVTLHIEDMHPTALARMIKEKGIKTPIMLLAYDNKERKDLMLNYDTSIFERIFVWSGDYHLLLGMVKYIEDKLNVDSDTKTIGVQVIILVEDNVRFYSSYLPLIYTEIFKQSQRLISEGVNITHRYLRMRARPKILLCTNYEEAWECYQKYEEYVLAIILDNNFKRGGQRDPEAGLKFAAEVKKHHKDIPILIQTSDQTIAEKAEEVGASYLLKNSPRLLYDLRKFMMSHFGFGDFIFKTPGGKEVARASNLKELAKELKKIPDESLLYHAEGNHFSKWLKARTEFWLAHQLRPRKVSDFASTEELRKGLITAINSYIYDRSRGVVSDFDKDSFDPHNSFARIGGGSLGGKARGLGFINSLIANYNIGELFKDTKIFVPSSIILGTDVFDSFMEENNLEIFALNETDDTAITRRFTEAPYFPGDIKEELSEFIDLVNIPLAVRSSSLLEDSQFQPFAGVYRTYMLPNNHPDKEKRLTELLRSIKAVYASTFHQKAKDYMKATSYRLEEEKMAVIVQKLIGKERNGRYYPNLAGVAKSYNFYPVPPQKSEDGIALVALGLGKTVVEGGNAVRFCPRYPKHLLQFFSTKETIKNAQQSFFALDLNEHLHPKPDEISDLLVKEYNLEEAEKDGTLYAVGSTYSPENDAVYDGVSREGIRVVTFAPILKHNIFPLPEILNLLLGLGTWGMGTSIEIEFAVNLDTPKKEPKEFAMLQMRPLVINREMEELSVDEYKKKDLICYSDKVLGNGLTENIFDIVVVDIHKYDRGKSKEVANEISRLNTKLIEAEKPYVLIGVGRWGSLDPWLGIPVTWDQISGAAAIVESGFKDFNVTPSQGSHFFQNLTSFKVGYFTVNSFSKIGYIDWDWLLKQRIVEELEFTKHIAFNKPVSVKINGHKNKGVITKPGR
ncbi:phosphoenolpyruvate synthase [bacterium BMS3Abin03]|nr:phosphoenolpyruvate synthase [bacterium BMS3Abin03]